MKNSKGREVFTSSFIQGSLLILGDEYIPTNLIGYSYTCDQCCSCLPEFPQGSTLFTLLDVSPQGSGGGAIEGGAPPPQGSELVGDVGDATPHGSVGAVPHGPDTAGAETVGEGEGPAELTVAATAGVPHGSTALSSIKALCTREYIIDECSCCYIHEEI